MKKRGNIAAQNNKGARRRFPLFTKLMRKQRLLDRIL